MTTEPAKISNMDELQPRFRVLLDAALSDLRGQGYDVRIIETYRTQERQDWLRAHGKTKAVNSVHTLRLAADFGVWVGGELTWDVDRYNEVGFVFEKHGLIWGGRFHDYDGDHVQMRGQP